jgi:hypothetical protein
MSALFSNILTNTTSRYQNLRQQLLNSEADGDTEDDSHISRVLRAYYTEKGRPFPQWLPPDPKAPQAAPTQFASSRQQGQAQPIGGRGGGLSDLWDTPQQQQQPQEPLSLRRGPGARGGGARPLQGRPGMGNSLTPEPQSQGKPLPNQRTGSYQSSLQGGRQSDASPPPSAGSGTTAQERLKARLWGRSNSPAPSASSDAGSQSSRMGSYNQPPAQGGRAPYQDDRSNSYGSAGSGGGRQQSSSGMSSNSPWVGNDDPYGPGYDRGPPQRGPAGGRVGLPSGPRMR